MRITFWHKKIEIFSISKCIYSPLSRINTAFLVVSFYNFNTTFKFSIPSLCCKYLIFAIILSLNHGSNYSYCFHLICSSNVLYPFTRHILTSSITDLIQYYSVGNIINHLLPDDAFLQSLC